VYLTHIASLYIPYTIYYVVIFIKNKIFHAAIIVSFILISSAIFISQTDKIFGKAAAASITGTMVLHDAPVPVSSINVVLPGSSCTTTIMGCGDAAPTRLSSYSGTPASTYKESTSACFDVCSYGSQCAAGSVDCGSWASGSCAGGGGYGPHCSPGYTCGRGANYPTPGTCCPSTHNYISGADTCCPKTEPYYNSGDGKCYPTKTDYVLKLNRLCGYTYEPLPLAPTNLDFDRDVKYVSISYSCTP